MTVQADQMFSGSVVAHDTSAVSSTGTAGNVAITLTNVKPGLTPTTNMPTYFNVVQLSPTSWQVKYTGVTIPKTATTLTITIGNQIKKIHLFVN